MKNVLAAGLVIIGAVSLGTPGTTVGAGETSEPGTIPVEIRAERSEVCLGDTFSVEVAIDGEAHATWVDVKVSYDPDLLHCLSAGDDGCPTGFRMVRRDIDPQKGTLAYTAALRIGAVGSPSPGSICSFTFRALRTGRAEFQWRRFGATSTKGAGLHVPFTLKAASVVIAERVEAVAATPVPECFDLSQNYPNPFNPETRISYQLPVPSLVRLRMFNILGQEVRTLFDGEQAAGYHVVLWDGRNKRGSEVPSGTYFCRMEADGFTKVRRMTLLR